MQPTLTYVEEKIVAPKTSMIILVCIHLFKKSTSDDNKHLQSITLFWKYSGRLFREWLHDILGSGDCIIP